jgi:hypothetical protein
VDAHDLPLAHATPARERPFRQAGRRAAVLGTERRGVTATQADGVLLTGPVRLVALTPGGGETRPVAANVVQAPRLLRRELAAPGTTLWELLLVPAELPGFAFQWRAAGAGGWTGRLEVDLPPDPHGGARHASDGGTLRVAGPPGDATGCVLHVDPPAPWSLEPATRRASARVEVPEGGALTLLVAAVDGSGRLPGLGALGALEAHRRRARDEGDDPGGARLDTGVREMDEGFAWARSVLRAQAGGAAAPPVPGPGGPWPPALAALLAPPALPAWTVLGATAAGELQAARAWLGELGGHPLAAAALADWVAWTGDAAPLRAARREIEESLQAAEGDPRTAAWVPLLRARLAEAGEALGGGRNATPPAATPVPSPAARAPGAFLPGAGGGLRLPTLRSAPSDALAAALLGDAPDAGGSLPEAPDDPWDPGALLIARARYAGADPDGGFALLRPALGAPVRDGPPVAPLHPALVAATLVGGLLGARPDAPYGRLRLAPALPATWTRFRLDGLRVGDTSLDLEYRREADRHTWLLRPTAGAVPLTIVLEPRLSLAVVHAVRVDGRPAEVDVFPVGGRTSVRLQLPLDSDRSLTVEGAGHRPP